MLPGRDIKFPISKTGMVLGDTAPLTADNPAKVEWTVPDVIPSWADQERNKATKGKKE